MSGVRLRALALVAAAACCTTSRTVGQPPLSVHDQTITLTRHDKVDILFLIDDSSSMTAKQQALQKSFPELVTRIQNLAISGLPASFHIGVVDGDLGAGLNAQSCKPGGDGGRLRTGASTAGTTPPPAGCASFTLPSGYIDVDTATGMNNLGGLDVATALTCLASAGDMGCGFDHPLEAVYRALTDSSINAGFVRDDALLVVVFLTDEDDCSAPDDTPLFESTAQAQAMYGVLHSFRCTQFGITCDGHALTGGALSAQRCTPVAGGPLFDVSRYTALFSDGGIKQDGSDVLLVAIDAPASPFAVTITQPCADQPNAASCPMLSRSCVSPSNPELFGEPAVRIAAVTSSTASSIAASICDDDYTATIDSLADAMTARMRGGCLPGALVDLGDPGCDVTVGGVDVPRCDSGESPCWDLVADPGCPARLTPGGASQTYRITVAGALTGAIAATCPLYEPTP